MKFRWGIAGTGRIASDFVDGLRQVPDADVVAVCSRSSDSAREFANRRTIARAYGSYEALADDPNVDIVYVATPNSRHRSDTEMYLRAGKHVLCEKPFALNLTEAKSMVRTARDSKRFVMEAIWSRFLPVYVALGATLESQPLGRVTRVEADFGFVAPTDAHHRLNDPALGGGSVLDLGIYCLHVARFVLGGHESVHAVGELNNQGVDVDATYTLGYASGATAVLRSSLKVATPCVATITGERGTITVERRMHVSPGFTVALNDKAAVYHAMMRTVKACDTKFSKCIAASNKASSKALGSATLRHSRTPRRWMRFAASWAFATRATLPQHEFGRALAPRCRCQRRRRRNPGRRPRVGTRR